MWRFNDDFRIAAADFGHALAAVEDLASAARNVGLTINEAKTITPRFTTYALDNFGLDVDDELPENLRSHEPEDFVGDYTDGVGETDSEWASALLHGVFTPPHTSDEADTGIDLSSIRSNDYRKLRRALARLTRDGDLHAEERLVDVMRFVPALTPWVIRYLIACGANEAARVGSIVDEMATTVALSDWQRMWLVRAYRELRLLTLGSPDDRQIRLTWVSELTQRNRAPFVIAEAKLAQAEEGSIEFGNVDSSFRGAPAALAPWYLVAMRALKARDAALQKAYDAVRSEGGVAKAILAPEGSV